MILTVFIGQVAMLSTGDSDACACDLPLLTFSSVVAWIIAITLGLWILWDYRCDSLRGSIGWLTICWNFGSVGANTCPSCDAYSGTSVSLTISLFVITALLLLQTCRTAGRFRVKRGGFGPAVDSEMVDRGSGNILITNDWLSLCDVDGRASCSMRWHVGVSPHALCCIEMDLWEKTLAFVLFFLHFFFLGYPISQLEQRWPSLP